jgi:YD repeat-containing protein
MKHLAAILVFLAPVLMGPVCPMGGGGPNPNLVPPPPPPPPPDGTPPGLPQAPLDEEYTGTLGDHNVGRPPVWLAAPLPIDLSPHSRNLRITLPFLVYNSRAALGPDFHDEGLGGGWSLLKDQSLERVGDRVIVRDGDLTEHHFSLHMKDGQERWIPEPYLLSSLEYDSGDDTWTMVDIPNNTHVKFEKAAFSGRYHRTSVTDEHGFVRQYIRNADGRLDYITDTVLRSLAAPSGSSVAFWYKFTWSSSAPPVNRLTIEDADGREWTFLLDTLGRLEAVSSPADLSGIRLEYAISYEGSSNLISSIRYPELPHPVGYVFNTTDGALFQIDGPESHSKYTASTESDGSLALSNDRDLKWRVQFKSIPMGRYVSSYGTDDVVEFERNDLGYMTKRTDPDGRITRYEPDDGARPGGQTKLRHPLNDGVSDNYTIVTHWGPYYNATKIIATPGPTTELFYEGLDNGGECAGSGEPWASLSVCKQRTTNPSTSVTVTYETRIENGKERRVTFTEHAQDPMANTGIWHDTLGRIARTRNALGSDIKVTERHPRGMIKIVESNTGVTRVLEFDNMGTNLSTTLVHPDQTRGWQTKKDYTPAGTVRSTLYRYGTGSASGNITPVAEEKEELENPSPTGVPQRTVNTVVAGSGNRWGITERTVDELGRTTQIISDMPPSPDVSVDGHRPFWRSPEMKPNE